MIALRKEKERDSIVAKFSPSEKRSVPTAELPGFLQHARHPSIDSEAVVGNLLNTLGKFHSLEKVE